MVKIQVDLPEEVSKKLDIYKIKEGHRYKTDALIKIVKEFLNEKED